MKDISNSMSYDYNPQSWSDINWQFWSTYKGFFYACLVMSLLAFSFILTSTSQYIICRTNLLCLFITWRILETSKFNFLPILKLILIVKYCFQLLKFQRQVPSLSRKVFKFWNKEYVTLLLTLKRTRTRYMSKGLSFPIKGDRLQY